MSTILDYLVRVRGGQEGQRELKKMASGIGDFAGRLNGLMVLAVAAAPTLLSLAASASAAGAAAGVVGAAGLVAMAVSLGGVIAVGKMALGQIKKVKTAQDAYNLAVQQYGPASDQATAARAKFLAVVSQNGGQNTLDLLTKMTALTDRFTKATQPARAAMTKTFGKGLDAANKLLPTFTAQTNLAANALRRGLTNSFRQLSGGEIKASLARFGATGAVSLQPIIHGITDIAFAIIRLLRPALKYVVQGAFAFQTWAHRVRAASSDGERMTRIVDLLVGNFKSWWRLAVALGTTLGILFGASVSSGQGFVDTLTMLVQHMNAFLFAARDSGALGHFFDQNSAAVRRVVSELKPLAEALLNLAQNAVPAIKSAGGAAFGLLILRIQILTALVKAFGPAAGPMLVAFIAWKAAVVGIAAGTEAWTIAQKINNKTLIVMRVQLAAMAVGAKLAAAAQWLWNASLYGFPLVWIIAGIALLVVGIVLLIKHWGWVKQAGVDAWNWIKTAAANAWGWIKDHWTTIVAVVAGPFGIAAKLIIDHFGAIKSAFRAAINWVIQRWNSLHFTVPTLKIKGHNVIPGGGSSIGVPNIPLLAEGGNVRQGGSVIVGDAGPEVLDVPAGARVTPLDRPGGLPFRDIIVKVDRRTLVRVTRDEIAAQMARG